VVFSDEQPNFADKQNLQNLACPENSTIFFARKPKRPPIVFQVSGLSFL
jgi:hypothetical protein